jgi:transcriptional regulator with GAF, ATPase, and Fis domain
MPLPIQAKLLRVIQDGVVRRLGSTNTDAVVNVRFIAATNRDPQHATADDVLRTDLFYRLCVVPIHIPPLRERPADIPLLAQHFLERYWAQHRGSRSAAAGARGGRAGGVAAAQLAGQRAGVAERHGARRRAAGARRRDRPG